MSLRTYLTAAFLAAFAGATHAGTVLAVEGKNTGSTTLGIGQVYAGVAQTFNLTKDITDADFDLSLRCLGGCRGEVWLIEGEMSIDILNSDVVTRSEYSGASGPDDVLQDLDLSVGTYTIILTMDKVLNEGGFWRATNEPTLTELVGTVTSGYERFETISSNFLPWSQTETVSGDRLRFSIDGMVAMAPVPLPASFGLLLAGLGGLAVFRRRSARRG